MEERMEIDQGHTRPIPQSSRKIVKGNLRSIRESSWDVNVKVLSVVDLKELERKG